MRTIWWASRRSAQAWCLAAALVVATVVVVATGPSGAVMAAPVAPVAPLPECVSNATGSPGAGCAPDDGEFGAEVEGLFSVGNSFTIVTTGSGLEWCHHYKQLGCLYSLSAPRLIKCVYLFEGDPADVRQCANTLSTTGTVDAGSAQQQGTCHGALGSTYAYGGPATDPTTYWDARAPKLAQCEFTVDSQHAIDRLAGPTFFLVSTRVGECTYEPGHGCDESAAVIEPHIQYAWLPVHGTLAPRASFDWAETSPKGKIQFDNTSVPFDGKVTWDWDFDDDDAYSTAFEPSHTYTESGVYRVTLTMTGPKEGQVLSTTRNVVINLEGADLMVSIHDPAAAIPPEDGTGPADAAAGYRLGQRVTLIVQVFNIGDSDVFETRPIGELLDLPPHLALAAPVEPIAPFTLAVGHSWSEQVPVRVVDIGRFTVRSHWTADDEFGIPVATRHGEMRGVVKGPDLAPIGDLTVTVDADPLVLETDGAVDTSVAVLVTIENKSPSKHFSEVALSGPLVWTPLYRTTGLARVDVDFADRAAVEAAFGWRDEIELGPLSPGQSHTYAYALEVDGFAHAALRQLVRAETPTGDTYRVGTRNIRIGGDTADAESVVPARLLDTRIGDQFATVDGQMQGIGRLAAATIVELPVLGRGGIEPDAPAVMLNVPAITPDGPGFLTVFPCGEELPTASNVNYTGGQTVPNAVLAKVGVDGKVCIYTLVGTDLIVDVNGYVPVGGELDTVVPARLLETRQHDGAITVDGTFQGAGRAAAASITEVRVTGRGGVAANATAAMLNVTAVAPDGPGYLTVFPCGQTPPNASNVNYGPGDVTPNAVLAKIGTGGRVCIYSHAATDLVVDVNGYVPDGAELDTVVPARLLETRSGAGMTTVDGDSSGGGQAAARSVTEVVVAGRGGVPEGVAAVMLNVTAVVPDGPGFVTVFPCGADMPLASNLNYGPGDVAANAVLAKVGDDGKVCLYTYAATDLIVDVNGYVP